MMKLELKSGTAGPRRFGVKTRVACLNSLWLLALLIDLSLVHPTSLPSLETTSPLQPCLTHTCSYLFIPYFTLPCPYLFLRVIPVLSFSSLFPCFASVTRLTVFPPTTRFCGYCIGSTPTTLALQHRSCVKHENTTFPSPPKVAFTRSDPKPCTRLDFVSSLSNKHKSDGPDPD